MMIFCRAHTVVHSIFIISCFVGVGLMWTWSLFLHWSRIDEFVIGLNSADELCHFPPMGIGSVEWTLANRPRGRFAWTNHINFQVTKPGSSTSVVCTNRGGRIYKNIYLYLCISYVFLPSVVNTFKTVCVPLVILFYRFVQKKLLVYQFRSRYREIELEILFLHSSSSPKFKYDFTLRLLQYDLLYS